MKPLFLKISGLNSFREEQEIDFTKLCDCGVFGIFGPTGSGKSTVLDAITLALYGNVERAERGTQGIINQNEEKVYVHFKFAIGGRKFIVERTYKRTKEGGVNQQSCRLLEEVDDEAQVLAENKRDIDTQINEIIGLTVEDFTKAVVLPQGKFQEFLKLKGTDRRSMLQRLFALEKYGEKLTKKIGSKLREAKAELNLVVSRQNELGDASKKIVEDARQNLTKEKQALEEIKNKDVEIKKEYDELKQVLEWQKELTQSQSEKNKLDLQKAEMVKQGKKIELALKAKQIQPFIAVVNNEQATRATIKIRFEELTHQVKVSEENFESAQAVFTKCQTESQTRGEELKVTLARLQEAAGIETKRDELEIKRQKLLKEFQNFNQQGKKIENEIKDLEENRQKSQVTKKELLEQVEKYEKLVQCRDTVEAQREAWLALQDINKRLKDLEEELQGKDQEIKELNNQKNTLEKQVTELQEKLADKTVVLNNLTIPPLTQTEINERNRELNALINTINILEQKQSELTIKNQEIANMQSTLQNLAKGLQGKDNYYQSLALQKADYLQEITSLEAKFKELEHTNLASILSKQLSENQACPVCGSLEHPKPCLIDTENEALIKLSAEIEQKKENVKLLEEDLQKAFTEKTALEAQVEALNTNRENALVSLGLIKEARDKISTAFPGQTLEDLKTKKFEEVEYLAQAQQLLVDYGNDKERLTNELNLLKDQVYKENIKLREVLTKKVSLGEDIEKITNKLNVVQGEVQEKNQNFVVLAQGQSGPEILQRVATIREASQALNGLRERADKITNQLDNLVEKLFTQKEAQDALSKKIESLVNEGQTCKNQIADLTTQITKLTKGLRVKEAQAQAEKELEQITNNLNKASQDLEDKRVEKEKVNTEYYSTAKELEQIQARLIKAKLELDSKLKEYQFVSQGEAESALCTPSELEKIQSLLENYQQSQLIVNENIIFYQGKLAGRSLSNAQWQEFQKTMKAIADQLGAKLELVYKLEDRLETLAKNHKRWLELEKDRKEWQNLIDKLSELEKLFRGNTFIEFIAEEQLMQVAIDASQRLGELTQYRYGLEVDSDGGFVIRDDANGGLRRHVNTLSGGETFLTSLALALALSSQIQLRGKYPLEFFFLDEGFGTLDNHLLEAVMNSLERLRLDKMTIGIISHVPELKARVARRLLVEPAEKGGKGTCLQIELA